MLIMIVFHDYGYRYFKHFYREKTCKHFSQLFPNVVSYTRFVELGRDWIMLIYLEKSFGKVFSTGGNLKIDEDDVSR